MKRLVLIAAALIAAAPAAWCGSLPASLRSTAMIDAEMVRVGDLWDNAGDRAETVIAPAPQPGKRITADARWLKAVADAYGVDWQPATNFDRVVIERTAQMIDHKVLETEIKEALALEGVPAPFDFDVSNRTALNIMVPGNGPTNVAVRDVVWDSRNARFTATIEVPAGSPNALRQRISGRVFPVARIPVLTRAMARGEVIGERDVQWTEVRDEQIRRDVATDLHQLVGQEPRNQLRAGAPVRLAEVQRPVMVPRSSMVTISVKTPFMTLSTQGRAIEEGGKGDTIRVLNMQTKRTVEAIVDGPGTVTVPMAGARIAAAN